MANLNGNAYSNFTSVGMFGGGVTSTGTGNSASGFDAGMVDSDFQVPFTATNANPAVFTVNAAFAPYLVNSTATNPGPSVTVGYCSALYPYTVTSATPAVFTSQQLATDAYFNDLVGQGTAVTLNATGTAVVLVGAAPGGFTSSSFFNTQGAYFPGASQTVYYINNTAAATFNLSTSLTNLNGGTYVASTSSIAAYSNQSMVMVIGNQGGPYGGISTGVPYYIVGVSGSTFQLSLTAGGSAISAAGAANNFAGILQFNLGMQQISSTVGANQIPYGTAGGQGSLQGIVQNGWRVGLQPKQATTTAASLSLDENPQLMWQNVPGATCQAGNADSIIVGGSSYGTLPTGWGMVGGYSVTGAAGQYVDEAKAPQVHINETNGKTETTEQRKVRLSAEADALKAKSNRSAAEASRLEVVENALKQLK